MVLIKQNSLKSDIFFNPIFIPGFSGSGSLVRVQGTGPGPGSRVWVQGPGTGFRSSHNFCYNSTIIRIIVILIANNSTIIAKQCYTYFVENFAMNILLLKASFKREQSKDIYQKWTFTKKSMILLEALVRRCYWK